MASTTAIDATEDAATGPDSPIVLSGGQSIQVLITEPLTYNAQVYLQHSADGGSTFTRAQDREHNGVLLEQGVTRAQVTGPGTFKLGKTATDTAIAVYYDQ